MLFKRSAIYYLNAHCPKASCALTKGRCKTFKIVVICMISSGPFYDIKIPMNDISKFFVKCKRSVEHV